MIIILSKVSYDVYAFSRVSVLKLANSYENHIFRAILTLILIPTTLRTQLLLNVKPCSTWTCHSTLSKNGILIIQLSGDTILNAKVQIPVERRTQSITFLAAQCAALDLTTHGYRTSGEYMDLVLLITNHDKKFQLQSRQYFPPVSNRFLYI